MKVNAIQSKQNSTLTFGNKTINPKQINRTITVQRIGSGSAPKKDIIDKFLETKVGKFLKKVYCFGLDIDSLLK